MLVVINLHSISNPSYSILFPGKICSKHSSLAIFVNTSSSSVQCQLSFPLASLIRARVNRLSLSRIHSLAKCHFSVGLRSEERRVGKECSS